MILVRDVVYLIFRIIFIKLIVDAKSLWWLQNARAVSAYYTMIDKQVFYIRYFI